MQNGFRRVIWIGLDGVPAHLLFGGFLDQMPYLSSLARTGGVATLESCIPAITVPAWRCKVSSLNPGGIGAFGFRNRSAFDYEAAAIANSHNTHGKPLWMTIGEHGGRVCTIGVPPSYPPKPVNGCQVGCFLTPSTESAYTYPDELRHEIHRTVKGYMLDVDDFRNQDRDSLLRKISDMTERRFTLARHLYAREPWDFFMLVEMGPDRLHHGFWKYCDPRHPKYQEGSKFRNVLSDYYRDLDSHVGGLVSLADEHTLVVVSSDHGAKAMQGSFNLNDWLIDQGYLALTSRPQAPTPFKKLAVDWPRTRAWAWGGYYGRVFLNLSGREPQGTVPPERREDLQQELTEKLENLRDHTGRRMNTRVFRPQDIYSGAYTERASDLIVYVDDLDWRVTESVGHEGYHSFDTELGPDDAVHDPFGIFIVYGGPWKSGIRLPPIRAIDCAPTILTLAGYPVPAEMEGKSLSL